jgi:hypothetical protein
MGIALVVTAVSAGSSTTRLRAPLGMTQKNCAPFAPSFS